MTRALPLILAVASCARNHRLEPPHRAVELAPAPLTRNQIAVGMAYACVHTTGDRLTCWGRSYPDRPTVVTGVDHVAGVVAAQARTCAWTTAGEVFCADGGPLTRVDGLTDVVELATDPDAFVTCARRSSGLVACWSDFDKAGSVHDVEHVSGALELAVAGTTACIRDTGGVACWNTAEATHLRRIPEAANATRISGGHATFVALRANRPPVAWTESFEPVALPALPNDVVQIALASKRACALGHAVWCWDDSDPKSLHEIPNLEDARELAVGYSLACAHVERRVACWGSIGSLGDGQPLVTDIPVEVANLGDAVRLASSSEGESTCARRANGRDVCWGMRADGTDPAPVDAGAHQLDEPDPSTRSWSGSHQRASWTCSRVDKHVTCEMTFFGRHGETDTGPEGSFGNLDDARDLRMPSNLSGDLCVADAAGAVTCFPASEGALRAVPVDGVTDVIQLAAYGEETCAVERAGTVKCWNERDREYNGGKVRTMANLHDAVEITGGSVSACARHRTGKVSCWGMRSLLGDNADSHQRVPLIVPGVTTP